MASNRYTPLERRLIKRGEYTGNTVHVANVQLDRSIRRLRGYRDPYMSRMEVYAAISSELDASLTALEQANPRDRNQPITWNDYYRLLGRVAFVHEAVVAPALIQTGDSQAKATLTNGTAGINVEIIESAVEEYNNSKQNPQEQAMLLGVINEHTAAAIGNRAQNGNELFLPGSIIGDLHNQLDITRYHTPHDEGYKTGVQIKSSKNWESQYTPIRNDRLVIYAKDFMNHLDLMTSKTLIKEHGGENLSAAEELHLHQAQAKFRTKIAQFALTA